MQLPEELQSSINCVVEKANPTALRRAREALSMSYRGGSSSVFQEESLRLAYVLSRMPATFSAVCQVLRQLGKEPQSWLDLGAGFGSASWAAAALFPNSSKFVLMERSLEAIHLGKRLAESNPLLAKAEWVCAELPCALPEADAAILSYSLGELREPGFMIRRWWESKISLLIVVEPGTPRGFSLMRKVRDQVLSLGAHLLAPCPHAGACPMEAGDWCHFSARISRTRLHRFVKDGALGYEDEKFSYLVIARDLTAAAPYSRVLRHPQKHSGHVRLKLCTQEGKCVEKTIGCRNKKLYKTARDSAWGGRFDL